MACIDHIYYGCNDASRFLLSQEAKKYIDLLLQINCVHDEPPTYPQVLELNLLYEWSCNEKYVAIQTMK